MSDTSKSDSKMLEALVCPITKEKLALSDDGSELIIKSGKRAYPIRNGIPIMLPDEARILD